MKPMLSIAALLCAAAPLSAQDAPKLELTIIAETKETTIGQAVQVEAHLKNVSQETVSVPRLIFDERSLWFSLTIDRPGESTPVTFDYSILQSHPLVAKRLELEQVSLAAGKVMVGFFKIPALTTGKMVVEGKFLQGDDVISAKEKVTLTVKPDADGGKKLAVVVDTTAGSFTIHLLAQKAPRNVAHFISLIQRRFYDGMIFHSIVRDKWLTTGCPFGMGTGGPGYSVKGERPEADELPHEAGTVSLCGFGMNGIENYTASQFFVCLRKLPAFNGKYTVIGAVTSEADQEILRDISDKGGTDATTMPPVQQILINTIKLKVVGE